MRRQSHTLHFNPKLSLNADKKHVRDGLSSVLLTGDNLWVSCDERTTLERLTRTAPHEFGEHCSYHLAELLDLPADEEVEIDIEGLASDSHYLWLIGSHSLKRKQPEKEGADVAEQIARLTKVKSDANRNLLARIPLVRNPNTGAYELHKEAPHPTDPTQTLRAAQLRGTDDTNDLLEALAHDPHLKPFLSIPGKDNGLDIEGLAVSASGQVFVGLRGPVLRGWAVVLELRLDTDKSGRLRLQPVPGATEKLYRKHFLELGGMGLRELRLRGHDLLVLAGPTMDLDGTIAVYRWPDATRQTADSLVTTKQLRRLFDVPHGYGPTAGQDKAEGMALLDDQHVLIAFDSPTDARKPAAHQVVLDGYLLAEEPAANAGMERPVSGKS